MSSGRILFIDTPHPFLHQSLEKIGYDCVFELDKSREELARELDQYIGIVCRSRFEINDSFIKKGNQLKFIARAGVGVEHIDVAFAEKQGISVFTSPEGSADAVAEHTIGLLLGLKNHLFKAYAEVRINQWLRGPNTGFELKGKTVGILGYGNMGRAFAKRLIGFGCKVIAYDKFKNNYEDEFVTEVNLEQFLKLTDVLSVHANYLPGNYHFINKNFISSFSKDIWIVNTARGLLIDTSALVDALKMGKVRGAALDVLEYEEISFDRMKLSNLPPAFTYLQNASNVVLTPHIAGWSVESYLGHSKVLFQKIKSFLKE